MTAIRRWLLLGMILGASACTTLTTDPYAPADPLERFNRTSYQVSDWVDRNALVPMARGYTRITPQWWRTGVGNVFANLRGIDSSVNGFLQGKPKRGATDFARILINSTLGIGGIFDVAKRAGLRAGNEDVGQTLAVWGVQRSRYIYVPMLGPSTVRDLPSIAVSMALPPLLLGNAYELWMGGLELANVRAQTLNLTDTRDASALDPYAFTREAYFQRRKFLIFDGDPPVEDFFDDEFDDFED